MDETINRDNLHRVEGKWQKYVPITEYPAVRMEGPFRVDSSTGVYIIQDGYLLRHESGYPIGLEKDKFEAHYKRVDK